MFDKTQVVNGRSTRSLLVSLAIHGALAIALFAVHFTVKSEITRRSARVQLIAPAAPLNRKHVAVRAPARPLVLLPDALADRTGPVFGDGAVAADESDLTRRHQGEPLGERIVVTGRVLGADGRPVTGTLIEVWQANAAV